MERTIDIHAAVGRDGKVTAAYYEHEGKDTTDVGLMQDDFYDYETKQDTPHRLVKVRVTFDIDAIFKDIELEGEVIQHDR